MNQFLDLFNYWVFVVLLMIGFYAVIARDNLIKKLLGLSVFQAAVFLLFISMGKVEGGTAPIIMNDDWDAVFSNPLPQVLILTAIVVGISTLSLGLAIVVRIKEAYGRISDIDAPDRPPEFGEATAAIPGAVQETAMGMAEGQATADGRAPSPGARTPGS